MRPGPAVRRLASGPSSRSSSWWSQSDSTPESVHAQTLEVTECPSRCGTARTHGRCCRCCTPLRLVWSSTRVTPCDGHCRKPAAASRKIHRSHHRRPSRRASPTSGAGTFAIICWTARWTRQNISPLALVDLAGRRHILRSRSGDVANDVGRRSLKRIDGPRIAWQVPGCRPFGTGASRGRWRWFIHGR